MPNWLRRHCRKYSWMCPPLQEGWNSQPKLPVRDTDKSVIRYKALEKHFQIRLLDTNAWNSTANLGKSFLRQLDDTPTNTLVHPTASICSITLFSILRCIRQLRTSKLMPGKPSTLSQRICTSRQRFKPLLLILYHVKGPRICHDAKNSRYRKIFLQIFEAFDHWKKKKPTSQLPIIEDFRPNFP